MLPDVTPSIRVLLSPGSTIYDILGCSTLFSIGRVGANKEEAGCAPEIEPSEPRVRHCRGADRRQWVVTPNTGMTCLLFTRDSRLIVLGSLNCSCFVPACTYRWGGWSDERNIYVHMIVTCRPFQSGLAACREVV